MCNDSSLGQTVQMVTPSRSVVVTGASTGIGRACVAELIHRGFQVWATVRTQTAADGLTAEFGNRVTPLIADLRDHDAVRDVGDRVVAAGALHGLVNNAGAALPAPLELMSIDTFREQLDINLVGQLLMTQVMMPALHAAVEAGDDPRIVMVGSIGGRIAGPVLGAYSAAKHGLAGMTASLRAELAPFGIRVVLIEPGTIATPIWGSVPAIDPDLARDRPELVARYDRQLAGARKMAEQGTSRGVAPAVPARVIADALTRPNPPPRQVVGRDAWIIAALVRLLPFRLIYRFTAGR